MRPYPHLSSWVTALHSARSNPSGTEVEHLLDGCRDYLLVIARQEWPADLQAKESPSDLVQQTLAEAYRDFPQFQGGSEAEWRAWVRRILLHNLQNLVRYYHRERRDVSREVAAHTDSSGPAPLDGLAAPGPLPCTRIEQAEQTQLLDEALAELPKDYREVIRLRYELNLPFAEIGSRMGRSADAAEKLWSRAVKVLAGRLWRHQ
jgi:RNA polymerase sigma-70 factor (ECF subfamily)